MNEQTWKVGDVANGHVLTEHGWLRQPSSVPMPPWQLWLLIGLPGMALFVALLVAMFTA